MIAQSRMDITLPSPLLGGLSPQKFMRRHWQKKPLLVRQAVLGGAEFLSRAKVVAMAASEEVESRLIVHRGDRWTLRSGPMPRTSIPPFKQPRWTLLLQGMDLHLPAARAMLERFRFVPDARLDDVMVSFATDGGGVGPHVDSYDVFLIQLMGRRRWRIGPPRPAELVPDVPLKILANFAPEQEWLLEPGDMLYLPLGWAHDGVAEGECMTCSVGFNTSGRDELAREVLQRMLDGADTDERGPLYRDPGLAATTEPGRIPAELQDYAVDAVRRLVADPKALACALGEVLSEPKRGVWFDAESQADSGNGGVRLDQRTRAIYDDANVYINGESFRASGRDARMMRRLADRRALSAAEVAALSDGARGLLDEWLDAGWLRYAA
jgi:50S ribosomal protein L16 3-hydroxylase